MDTINKLIILYEKHLPLTHIFKYNVEVIDEMKHYITLAELEQQCANNILLNMEILTFHMEFLYNLKINNHIKLLLTNHLYDGIFTPVGTLSKELCQLFKVTEIHSSDRIVDQLKSKNISIPLTQCLNSQFLNVHKINCIFQPNLDAILLLIMKKKTFLISYLQRFILHYNLHIKKGQYITEIIVFNNLEEGIKLLELNGWSICLPQLYDILNGPLNLWAKIYYCKCLYLQMENVDKEFHFAIAPLETTKTTAIYGMKRCLTLPLAEEVDMTNPMDFYKSHILKCNIKYYNKKKNNRPSIKKVTKSKELYLVY